MSFSIILPASQKLLRTITAGTWGDDLFQLQTLSTAPTYWLYMTLPYSPILLSGALDVEPIWTITKSNRHVLFHDFLETHRQKNKLSLSIWKPLESLTNRKMTIWSKCQFSTSSGVLAFLENYLFSRFPTETTPHRPKTSNLTLYIWTTSLIVFEYLRISFASTSAYLNRNSHSVCISGKADKDSSSGGQSCKT